MCWWVLIHVGGVQFDTVVCNWNLNEGNILSFGDDLSGGSIKKPNLNLISKLLPLKTTMDIPIIISCMREIQRLKSELPVVTCKHLYGWICQQGIRSLATVAEFEVTFSGQI